MTTKGSAIPLLIFIILVIGVAGGIYITSIKTSPNINEETNTSPENLTVDINTEEEPKKEVETIIKPETDSKTEPLPPVIPAITEEIIINEEPPVETPDLSEQFTVLEQELAGAKEKGLLLSQDHSERITSDLSILESGGYDKNEIDRLKEVVITLSPHLNQEGVNSLIQPEPTCESNPDPVFTEDITDVSRISKITPPGTIFSNGVVKSHSYLWIGDGNQVPLYAPVDMELSSGSYYEEGMGPQYLLFFEVSCEVGIKFDHVLNPIDAIRNVLPESPALNDSRTNPPTASVSFEAGELIGHTSGTSVAHNWDFGVYNTTLFPNPVTDGVANLGEVDKRADCGYDYFTAEKKAVYKNLFIVNIGGSTTSIPYCLN